MQEFAKPAFGSTGFRTVIVGQVKMRDARIKGCPNDGTTLCLGCDIAEVVPKAQRQGWEQYARLSASAVCHIVVTIGVR
jgi:hypothetical protein